MSWVEHARRRFTERDRTAGIAYTKPFKAEQESIEGLLRLAAKSKWPWDSPTFRSEWIGDSFERACRTPGLVVVVEVSWWARFTGTPWPDTLSVAVEELPSPMGGAIRMVVLCASSDSAAALVSNLMLALRTVGGTPDQLVKTLEQRKRSGAGFMHAIACIPGSAKG